MRGLGDNEKGYVWAEVAGKAAVGGIGVFGHVPTLGLPFYLRRYFCLGFRAIKTFFEKVVGVLGGYLCCFDTSFPFLGRYTFGFVQGLLALRLPSYFARSWGPVQRSVVRVRRETLSSGRGYESWVCFSGDGFLERFTNFRPLFIMFQVARPRYLLFTTSQRSWERALASWQKLFLKAFIAQQTARLYTSDFQKMLGSWIPQNHKDTSTLKR